MSNMLAYKGYHATVEYDADDKILVGTVFGVRDTLAFHGNSVSEITETFHDCIDTYLQVCAEQGISPDKEFKGSFNIRIPPSLHRQAALEAEKQGVSLNQFIQQSIEEHINPSQYKNTVYLLPPTQQTTTIQAARIPNYSNRYRRQPSGQLQ